MSQITKRKTSLSAKKIREKLHKTGKKNDSLPANELAHAAMESGSFDWLREPSEDIYSIKDGKEASWPAKRTNGAA
jgi:hypothetical protein